MQLHPKKQFGQNFLLDQTVIHRIISSLNIQPNEHILEIGPGKGALTKHLIPLAKSLDVIEIDRDLVHKLEEQKSHWGKFTIHSCDVLKFDFKQLPADKYRIIGNLPYNISTPLLFYLMEHKHKFVDITCMLQTEVAQRITATPHNKSYARLSIMLQYHCQANLLFTVPPEAFYPKPKVHSSVIRMLPYHTAPIACNNYALLEQLVATAFNQRRKTIQNSLKDYLVIADFIQLKLDPKLRAENCSLEDFVNIVQLLS